MRTVLTCFLLTVLGWTHLPGQYAISGTLKKGHKVNIIFDGPTTGETAELNPFTDYRLDVTFTKGDRSFRLPGYLAAHGNANNTSAEKGDKWRVHFVPDEAGTWTFNASFRTGDGAAPADGPNTGDTTALGGATGSFDIEPLDNPHPVAFRPESGNDTLTTGNPETGRYSDQQAHGTPAADSPGALNGNGGMITAAETSEFTPKGGAMRLFPNPIDGTLTVRLAEPLPIDYIVSCRILDADGEVVRKFWMMPPDEQSIPIELGDLPKGSYTLVLQTEVGAHTAPFVIR